MEYKILYNDGRAKRAEMKTVHGTVQTPVFMNVGTVGAIKGAVSTDDLKEIGTQVELSNTYHLHVRTGDKLIKQFGGLHKFMNWDRPILTDSGGFQVFSLSGLRKIKEEGVYFNSHIDGRKIFMGPEESMQIQSNLGSTIAMAFDECPSSVASREYVQASVDRTTRWLERCREEMKRLNAQPDTVSSSSLESIREQFTRISASGMQRQSARWSWTAMLWAAWPWVKPMRRCTVSSMRWFPIFRRISLRT